MGGDDPHLDTADFLQGSTYHLGVGTVGEGGSRQHHSIRFGSRGEVQRRRSESRVFPNIQIDRFHRGAGVDGGPGGVVHIEDKASVIGQRFGASGPQRRLLGLLLSTGNGFYHAGHGDGNVEKPCEGGDYVFAIPAKIWGGNKFLLTHNTRSRYADISQGELGAGNHGIDMWNDFGNKCAHAMLGGGDFYELFSQ